MYQELFSTVCMLNCTRKCKSINYSRAAFNPCLNTSSTEFCLSCQTREFKSGPVFQNFSCNWCLFLALCWYVSLSGSMCELQCVGWSICLCVYIYVSLCIIHHMSPSLFSFSVRAGQILMFLCFGITFSMIKDIIEESYSHCACYVLFCGDL